MDNLRGVIKNLFCYISPKQIIGQEYFYRGIDEDTFVKLGNSYIKRYSNDELKNMYRFMINEYDWQNRRISGEEKGKNQEKLNVFETLMAFDFSVLIEENCEPLCQYVHLMRWREMITVLEEDLFVTSFLAQNDVLRGRERNHFFWKPVIGHNNYALNRLMQEGIAENHFHLKGSAPIFHLTWINLMNEPDNMKFVGKLMEYDRSRLQINMEYGSEFSGTSYVAMWRQAALIRVFLFAFLHGDYLEAPNQYCTVSELCGMCDCKDSKELEKFFGERGIYEDEKIRISDYERELSCRISCHGLTHIKSILGERWTKRMLDAPEELEVGCINVKSNIVRLADKYDRKGQKYDYAVCKKILNRNPDRNVNEVICGERWFMYAMFTYIYGKKRISPAYINWFYVYLVIKAHMRMEIVQSNMGVGFDNFLLYQNRKEEFIDGTSLEKIYLKMAVRDTIYNQSIVSLEARITPKDTPELIINSIRKNDDAICMNLEEKEEKELKAKYFYVMHFIKEVDEKLDSESVLVDCRHQKKRKEVMRQAQALGKVREMGVEEASRIRGIDASSPEIVCRPEVFAQAFRYLKNHVPASKYEAPDFPVIRLRSTYHVGEDFLDVIDGLRAIDEAILFLNLKCGDRLGHALALGIDVEEWYHGKADRILISKQAYIDNLVWLYSRIRKFNIKDAEDAQAFIEKRFDEYFQEIYKDNILTSEYTEMVREAKDYFNKKKKMHAYWNESLNIGIHEYYDAWKLRGDNPKLYKSGFFQIGMTKPDEWGNYAVNKDYPQNYALRYNPAVAFLYHAYHYNRKVRETGEEMVEVKIQPCLIRAVKEVQKAFQKEISNLGIGIETNPSSNYLIGSFRRYDRHPIVGWYNNGLTFDMDELKSCPQMQVSINTDDQGVFATYLENEYAYMALALEKHLNRNGERVYNRSLILQWLDNIRKMGIHMSFGG